MTLGLLGLAFAVGAWYLARHGSPPPETVPRVLGLHEPRAVQRLTQDGFRVRMVAPSRRGSDVVVSERPHAGVRLTRGATITIRLGRTRRS